MENLLLIFLCLAGGYILRATKVVPEGGFKAINAFLIYISIPAFILEVIPNIPFDANALLPVAMAWIVFLLSIPFFLLLGKLLKLSKPVIGCLILVAGLGNTSFVGFPLLNYFLGPDSLQYGALADIPGSFLILPTLGILVASLAGSGKVSAGVILKRIFTFPPFLAFLLAIAIALLPVSYPDVLAKLFSFVGKNTLIPLALFSVGLQLNLNPKGLIDKSLVVGLVYKLVLAPAVIFGIYFLLMDWRGLEAQVSLLEAGMAPMVTASIVAVEFGLPAKLANGLVSIGIPISFVTVYLWYLLAT